MTVWLGLPGGEGGLLGLLPWLPCEVSPGCTSPPGVLVSVCRGGACPSLPLGRRLPWSPGCGGCSLAEVSFVSFLGSLARRI